MPTLRPPRAPKLPALRSKYGNRKTPYRGLMYDSTAEAKHAMLLDIRKASGEVKDWFRQCPVLLEVNGNKICKLVFDFKVWTSDHDYHYEEVKGMETREYRLKLKLLRALHPGMEIRVFKA